MACSSIRLAKRAEAKPKQIKVSVGSQKSIEGKKPEGQTHAASKGQVALTSSSPCGEDSARETNWQVQSHPNECKTGARWGPNNKREV